MSCPELPEQFVIKQDFFSMRKTFSIHTFAMNNKRNLNRNKNFINAMRNIKPNTKIASYKTKMLSMRGMVGYPRIRMYYRPNAKKSKEYLAGTANAQGSWKLSEMRDMRYMIKCGRDIFHIQEKKEGIIANTVKHEFGPDAFKMDFEIFKEIKSKKNKTPKPTKKRILFVTVRKKFGKGKLTTMIRFYDETNNLINDTYAKRITTFGNVRSLLLSKFFVQNKRYPLKKNNPLLSGYIIGLIAYIFSNNEMQSLSRGVNKGTRFLKWMIKK